MNIASLLRPVAALRLISFVEGLSYLVLLLVAMPLKYLMDAPTAVRVVGSVHGLLFVLFAMALFRAYADRGWPLMRAARVFIASMIPFGFVWIDRNLRPEFDAETSADALATDTASSR